MCILILWPIVYAYHLSTQTIVCSQALQIVPWELLVHEPVTRALSLHHMLLKEERVGVPLPHGQHHLAATAHHELFAADGGCAARLARAVCIPFAAPHSTCKLRFFSSFF